MSKSFDELITVMARLRAPGGCPWDAEQTYQSLSQYLLEEAYETFDAIHAAGETGDTTHLTEELGDLLLQVVFHSTIAAERGDFTIDDVAAGVAKKLVLRHPHVFGDAKLAKAQDVLDNWDELKANERAASGKVEKTKESLLDEIPVHFPALLEGLKVTKKAAKVGFDWENAGQIFAKIDEEIAELKSAIEQNDKQNIDEAFQAGEIFVEDWRLTNPGKIGRSVKPGENRMHDFGPRDAAFAVAKRNVARPIPHVIESRLLLRPEINDGVPVLLAPDFR